MADIRRVVVDWTTGPGGRGVSIYYTAAADDVTTNLATFYNAIKGAFPSAVTWSIPSAGDKIDVDTGHLTGTWSGGTAAVVVGGGASAYAAGTGFYVRWLTGGLRNSRKFAGKSFMVPILASIYDSTGTIDNANLGTFQTAANALVTANKLLVYGRPIKPATTGGITNPVTAAVVPDKVTSLKTRRS